MDISYIMLEVGEKLQKGDEYSTVKGVWRLIPTFMVGNIIPASTDTKWRRTNMGNSLNSKKHWWKK
jgi:hypothetical protein